MDIEDITTNGYVNQWTLVNGEPRCIDDPIPDTANNVVTVLQKNAAVRSYYNEMLEYRLARIVYNFGEPTPPSDVNNEPDLTNTLYVYQLEQYQNASNTINNTSVGVISLFELSIGNTDPVIIDTVNTELNTRAATPLNYDPRPVPQTIPMWRAKVALQKAGLLDKANALVAQLGDPVLSSYWEYAPEIWRTSPTLKQMGIAMELTDAQLDELFRQAISFTI